MMTAALILGLASVGLLQFFISYCRSVIAASTSYPLSDQIWEVIGIRDRKLRADEFKRVLQLTSLCPDSGTDHVAITAVRAYFQMVDFVRSALGGVLPEIVTWTESELSRCTHFAAVALDSRISHSRNLMAQQYSGTS